MTNPDSRQQSAEDERRGESEDAWQANYRFAEAPDKLAEIREAVESARTHFRNLDEMSPDFRFDRYLLSGWLIWARRDLDRAAELLGAMAPKTSLTIKEEIELGTLPF